MKFEEDPARLLYLVAAMRGGASYEEAVRSLQEDGREVLPPPMVAAAIKLSKETGGALIPLLESAARSFQQKKELSDKIQALAAPGTASAWVVGLTPVGLLATLSIFSWETVSLLFNTRLGNFLLAGAGLLMLAGFWTARRMVRMDDL